MSGENAAVFGTFTGGASMEIAVDRLTAAGFSSGDVSILMSDKEGLKVGVGGVVGGTLGLLAGIGALAIPGVGPVIAAGPIIASLAGLGVGGAVVGLVGALVGLGIPEYEAKLYDGRVRDGGVLLSVHCVHCDESRVRDILIAAGAEDIASSGEEAINIEDEADHVLEPPSDIHA
jgi:hypothetical protein